MVYSSLDLEVIKAQQALRKMGHEATAAALDCFLTMNCQSHASNKEEKKSHLDEKNQIKQISHHDSNL